MAYEVPQRRQYMWPGLDWHAGAITKYIQGPKGKRGRIVEVAVAPTTSFVGTTTPANVQVGYVGQLAQYAQLNVGAAGAGTAVGAVAMASDYAGGLTALNPASVPNTAPAQLMQKDTPVVVTMNPATGGGVAGVGDVWVVIDWF
jgi:hypothetical protein